jgi:hypothetical protein
MSYEIVKKIRIENNKVFITCASNNVYPRYFDEHESSYLSNILVNEGVEALDLYLLKAYEEGNFHKGTANKYSTAIDRLQALPIYENYSWRKRDYKNPNCQIEKNRASKEFDKLLLDSLKLKPSNFKAYLTKPSFEKVVYCAKVTSKVIHWTADKNKAKLFKDKEKIETVLRYVPNGNIVLV